MSATGRSLHAVDAIVEDARVDLLFRQAMGRLASGVVIVTCYVDDRPWGITATACCSISVAPPLLLVSLKSSTVSASAIQRTGRFGVSLLGARALDAAKFASRPGQPKYIDDYCTPCEPEGASATPIVRHAAAHVDCAVNQAHPAADHLLFIGDVHAVLLQSADRPLVYCSQSYHGLDALGEQEQRS
ncbi:flavin reductase family protein [Pseudonocardia sp. H11422]|uniref:flavin reductase family protein n=1 Tax=Pseudonocardia sp. H11422 TaxID=2835866 RepID=UPI001BDCFFB3|nr:flavin reductase family protein [Pseudonocardia sp. H11422]